jgi:hypothetical protein
MSAAATISQVAAGGLISAGTAWLVARQSASSQFLVEKARQAHELHRDERSRSAAMYAEAAIARGDARAVQADLRSAMARISDARRRNSWWPPSVGLEGVEPNQEAIRRLASALHEDEWGDVANGLFRVRQVGAWWADRSEAKLDETMQERLLTAQTVLWRAAAALDRMSLMQTPSLESLLANYRDPASSDPGGVSTVVDQPAS